MKFQTIVGIRLFFIQIFANTYSLILHPTQNSSIDAIIHCESYFIYNNNCAVAAILS